MATRRLSLGSGFAIAVTLMGLLGWSLAVIADRGPHRMLDELHARGEPALPEELAPAAAVPAEDFGALLESVAIDLRATRVDWVSFSSLPVGCERVRAELVRCQAIIDRLRAGASLPRFTLGLNYRDLTRGGVGLASSFEAVRLLKLDAGAMIERHQIDALVDDVKVLLRMARPEDPVLGAQLAACSGLTSASDIVATSLGEMNASQIADLKRCFAAIEPSRAFTRCLELERALGLQRFLQEIEGTLAIVAQFDTRARWEWRARAAVPLLRLSDFDAFRRWSRCVDLSRGTHAAWIAQSGEIPQAEHLPWYAVLSQGLTHTTAFRQSFDQATARVQLALAALEVQARALREGQVADAMTLTQRDPYGGGAVQYQRTTGGFVVFSIGPDLVNDHAACDIREGKRCTIEMGSARIAVASGDLLLDVPARR